MEVTQVRANQPRNLPMNGAAITTSAPATGNPTLKGPLQISLQLISAAASTVIVEVTNDPDTAAGAANNWLTLVTLATTGAGTDGFTSNAPWNWMRARTTTATTPTSILIGG